MKILVTSLLRLGDIILHAELIPAIKKQYPNAEIHFFINSQFRYAQDLFPEICHWHLLDRNSIQEILVEQRQSPKAAYEILKNTLDQINGQKFDLVLNATHNLLSVRLMDLIEAKEKRGAIFQNGKNIPFNNQWLHYFNDQFSEVGDSRFHYLEILHRALGLRFDAIPAQKRKSDGPILLQVLTADSKKNWGLEKFKQLKQQMLTANPEEKIFVLCSPQEKPQLQFFFSDEEILATSMTEAKDLLKTAKLLITGDTSIQHLAARVACPVLAIHLGSADPVKTSAWLLHSQVEHGNSACYPCRASEKCSQKSHLCGDGVSVGSIIEQTFNFLRQNYQAQIIRNGEHHFCSNRRTQNVALEKMEQLVWGFYLDGQIAEDVFILPEIGSIESGAQERYQKLDARLNKMNAKIEKISKGIFQSADKSTETQSLATDIKQDIQSLVADFPEISDSFFKMQRAFEMMDKSFFEFLRVLRAGFRESQSLNAIRQRLILIELRKPVHTDRIIDDSQRSQEVSFE